MRSRKKTLLSKLPLNLGNLSKISSKVLQGLETAQLRILVDITSPQLLRDYACKQLFPLGQSVNCEVVIFGSQSAGFVRPHLDAKADLNLLIAGSSEYNSIIISQSDEFEIPLVTIAADFSALIEALASRAQLDSSLSSVQALACNIIPAPAGEDLDADLLAALFAELGRWVARNLSASRQAFGRAYPFMRYPIAVDIINSTAFANAAIAAAFFIPGADMPVLTLNQAKMLIQIASLYGLELGTARLKEAAALVLAAFGARTLARQLVRRLSLVAWAVRALMAYSTTQAVGRTALAYYEKGAEGFQETFLDVSQHLKTDVASQGGSN